jgi:hypothetical protein
MGNTKTKSITKRKQLIYIENITIFEDNNLLAPCSLRVERLHGISQKAVIIIVAPVRT